MQTGQSAPLRNIVCASIEPTVPQLESWVVSDNGASDAINLYAANDIWVQHWLDPRVNTCLRMIWLRRVGMFLGYKVACSKDYECTELLECSSNANAMRTKHLLEPTRMYATQHKQEIDQYRYHLGLIRITEIGESQAMIISADGEEYLPQQST